MRTCSKCKKDKIDEDFSYGKPTCNSCYSYSRRTNFDRKAQRYKESAAAAKVKFDLDGNYLESIWVNKCPILGIPISLRVNVKSPRKAHLDRLDPKLGYTKGNVNWISRRANRIKQDGSLQEIEAIAKWMRKKLKNT